MKFFETDFVLNSGPVIPVLALNADETLEPMAEALVAGGIKVFEVVLRTPSALEVIKRLNGRVPILGAGTILNKSQMLEAQKAGATFCVSPGLTEQIHVAAVELEMPLLPGAVTASEIMNARELNYRNLKFFPAERSGGPAALADFAAVFPDSRFCPTGGVSAENASLYLENKNVSSVGGSMATPRKFVMEKDWAGLQRHVEKLIQSLT